MFLVLCVHATKLHQRDNCYRAGGVGGWGGTGEMRQLSLWVIINPSISSTPEARPSVYTAVAAMCHAEETRLAQACHYRRSCPPLL